jgi:hypothetical protein
MRKLFWMVGLVVVAVACGTAGDMVGEMLDSGVPDAGAQPTPTPVAKFVGYTAEAHPLGRTQEDKGGLFDSYAACRADFGATARICTTAEVLGTADLPAPPPAGSGATEGAWFVETLNTVPRCWGQDPYNTDSGYLTPSGTFDGGRCYNLRVLACCTTS